MTFCKPDYDIWAAGSAWWRDKNKNEAVVDYLVSFAGGA